MRARRLLAPGLGVVLMTTGGCAVHSALEGTGSPDLGVVRGGVTRGEIEAELGAPVAEQRRPRGGSTATYEYREGDRSDLGRALGHLGMDILTLGVWEAVAPALEDESSTRVRLNVVYDLDGRAVAMHAPDGTQVALIEPRRGEEPAPAAPGTAVASSRSEPEPADPADPTATASAEPPTSTF